ncbi:MAG: DUF4345 family protein [Myxococcota bacterium]
MDFPRFVLLLAFGTFAFFGISFLVIPQTMAAVVDIHPASTTALSDVMAVYGGLEVAIALVLARYLTQKQRTAEGLWLAAVLFGGLGGGRLLGVLVHQPISGVTFRVLTAEWFAAAGCAFAWWRHRRGAKPLQLAQAKPFASQE